MQLATVLERGDDRRSRQNEIVSEVRHRRVSTLAGHGDLEDIEVGHHRAGAQCDGADGLARPVVHAVDRLGEILPKSNLILS